MKILDEKDQSERLKKIFETANEIFLKTFDYSIELLEPLKKDPFFNEMQDFEVLSFFSNIYTKLLCKGFEMLWEVKSRAMKEHDITKSKLLHEWIQGIYAMFGVEVVLSEVKESKDKPLVKLNYD